MPELQRQPGKLDINIEDEVRYGLGVIYKINDALIDVTGYTATFELRDESGTTTTLLSLDESAGITVGGADGRFDVLITDAQSAFGDREMEYDLIITPPSGETFKLLHGKCKSWARGD